MMIRPVEDRERVTHRTIAPQKTPATATSQKWHQEIEQWIRERPEVALALAATVGAALGWLIKRRT